MATEGPAGAGGGDRATVARCCPARYRDYSWRVPGVLAKYRLLGLLLGVAVFLAAFGVALAVTIFQVTREVTTRLIVQDVSVLSTGDLGLYHDPAGTQPVTSMDFILVNLQPLSSPHLLARDGHLSAARFSQPSFQVFNARNRGGIHAIKHSQIIAEPGAEVYAAQDIAEWSRPKGIHETWGTLCWSKSSTAT